MTTEPKAEGVEAVAWLCVSPDGAHVDATASENTRKDYERFGRTIIRLYLHPTTPAVEALARAAVLLREIAPHFWCDESAYIGTLDAAIKAVDTALAHPEIAALLKGEKV